MPSLVVLGTVPSNYSSRCVIAYGRVQLEPRKMHLQGTHLLVPVLMVSCTQEGSAALVQDRSLVSLPMVQLRSGLFGIGFVVAGVGSIDHR